MKESSVSGLFIQLSGEYDIARKDELTEMFGAITSRVPITIDMTDVTYVDSTFLAAITAMRLRLADIPVTLLGVQPNVERILQLAKLDRFFTFE
jgi:anti-anti-sigma factor